VFFHKDFLAIDGTMYLSGASFCGAAISSPLTSLAKDDMTAVKHFQLPRLRWVWVSLENEGKPWRLRSLNYSWRKRKPQQYWQQRKTIGKKVVKGDCEHLSYHRLQAIGRLADAYKALQRWYLEKRGGERSQESEYGKKGVFLQNFQDWLKERFSKAIINKVNICLLCDECHSNWN
jgi:hypothetical protein